MSTPSLNGKARLSSYSRMAEFKIVVFSMPFGMLSGLLQEVYAEIVHPDYFYNELAKDITQVFSDEPESALLATLLVQDLLELSESLDIPSEFVSHELTCIFEWVLEMRRITCNLGRLKQVEIKNESTVIFIYQSSVSTSAKETWPLQHQKTNRELTRLRYAISQESEQRNQTRSRTPIPVQPLEPIHPRSIGVYVP